MSWPGVDDRKWAPSPGTPALSGAPSEPVIVGSLPDVAWGLKEVVFGTLIGLAVFVLVAVAVVLPLAIMDTGFSENSAAGLGLNSVFYLILLAVPLVVARRAPGGALRALGFRPLAWRASWRVPIGLASTYAVLIVSTLIIATLGFTDLEPQSNVPEELFRDRATVIVAFLVIGLMAPFAEEVFFRGFVFAGLARSLSLIPGLAVSGLLFGAAHQDLTLLIPFSLVGVVLAWTYMRTGSLWGSIAVHAAFNLISLTIGVVST